MRINGEKINIRDLRFSDLDAYFEYGKDPNVGPFAGWKPFPSKDIASRVLNGQIVSKETYAIALKDKDMLVGTISLYNTGLRKYNKAKSLGFSLSSAYWNQGIMTEAVKLMITYAFEKTDCEILEVGHHTDNFRCKRVAEKCGFNYDGTLCSYKKLYDGRLIDACFYSMTREEYERKKKYE
ncbi:MAG: GNAT family N-acetyltransferase [Anaeroplasmataceae bacterium]|nr:GNAT family N-acetyltransferase [Anaeroplasmataceae bacterium]